jgi:spore maturation protein CgeB
MVRPEVLRFCHIQGALTFNFYPDQFFYSHNRGFEGSFSACIREYDCIFTPKSNNIDLYKNVGALRVEFMPYAFDPWCHFPVELTTEENLFFASDVAFIGTWGQERSQILEDLVRSNFPYRLSVWGNYWNKLSAKSQLRQYIKFQPVYGSTQAKIFNATKIALGFLLKPDLHTARSFEIPAYGAFMLAERTIEHNTFFTEGKEIACFDGVEELHEKINYYLSHDDERIAIAKAGFKKVTEGGNSYIDRMQRVLDVYQEMTREN